MHVVKRAIIMAAGVGKRMRPVSITTPKPLIKVNGKRMIDTVISGLHNNGINEIYVVVGYLKEQFYILEKQYAGVKIVENPYYNTCNNISSLYVARDYIEDSMIIDGDQIIYNDSILSRSFELSGYNAIWTENETSEWLMQERDGVVASCNREGGKKGWQLFSISRWNKEDGRKLKCYIEKEFEEYNNRQLYWDDVVMFLHFNDFKLGIKPMRCGDVIEIDNYDELVALDSSYKFMEDENGKKE